MFPQSTSQELLTWLTDSAANSLEKRDASFIRADDTGYTIHCACGLNLNPDDISQAIVQLQDKVGSDPLVGWGNFTGIAGEVIAFVCQKQESAQENQPLQKFAIPGTMDMIKRPCGQSVPGTFSLDGYDRYLGYMQYSHDLENHVCDSPDSATAATCPKRSEYRAISAPPTAETSNALDTRDGDSIHCACGIDLDPADTQAAIAALKQILNMSPTLSEKTPIQPVSRSVVAFICQDDSMPSPQYIDPKVLTDSLNSIGSACGPNIAGTYQDNFGSSGNLYYGYMRFSGDLNMDVCKNPASATASKCGHSRRSEDDRALLAPRTADITNVLHNRDNGGVLHCACGFNTDSGNTQSAIQGMQNQISMSGTIEEPSTSVVDGDVISFICLHNTATKLSIDGDTYKGYIQQITSACGENIAGTYSVYDSLSGDTRHFGYMRYSGGLEFHICDSPDSASATSCSPNKRSETRTLPSPTMYNTSNVLDSRDPQPEVANLHCLCGTTVDESNYNDANATMTADLNTGKFSLDSSGVFRHVVVKGDVVAFVCIQANSADYANAPLIYGGPTEKPDFSIDLARIRNHCGAYVPGSYARYSDDHNNHYGFFQTAGRNLDADAICTSKDLSVEAGKC